MRKETKQCSKCRKLKNITSFYSTESPMFPDRKLPFCKTCLLDMIDPSSEKSFQDALRQIDKPYIVSLWRSCSDKANPVGEYLRQVNSLPQHCGLTWANSSFGDGDEDNVGANPQQPQFVAPARQATGKPPNPSEVPIELYDKWGYGFKPNEIMAFETLYNELKNNYQLPTASHVEFLKLACISRVKAVNAMAEGDVKTAKEYMSMFKDTTAAGKLTPASFSKSDLTGGLDTFSELVRQVEKTVDIIPTLPRFKERPQDKVDIVLWAYINYVQKLKGLKEASYEDIWKFYDVRKKDYESAMALVGSEEDG